MYSWLSQQLITSFINSEFCKRHPRLVQGYHYQWRILMCGCLQKNDNRSQGLIQAFLHVHQAFTSCLSGIYFLSIRYLLFVHQVFTSCPSGIYSSWEGRRVCQVWQVASIFHRAICCKCQLSTRGNTLLTTEHLIMVISVIIAARQPFQEHPPLQFSKNNRASTPLAYSILCFEKVNHHNT